MTYLQIQSFAKGASDERDLASIEPLPLRQESRILVALRRARGPLPRVTFEHLESYFDFLAARLVMPFEASYAQEIGAARSLSTRVTVTAILPPGEVDIALRGAELDLGFRCRGFNGQNDVVIDLIDLEVDREHANSQLLEDYWYWFWNWRFDPGL